ncbi:MAG: hypothetical protein ABFD69_15530 [Candidatus Sumerlaeia bacterium]
MDLKSPNGRGFAIKSLDLNPKSEIRNPKSETNPKFKFLNSGGLATAAGCAGKEPKGPKGPKEKEEAFAKASAGKRR